MKPICFLYNPTAGETVITEWLDSIVMIYQQHGYMVVPYRLSFKPEEEHALVELLGYGFRHVLIAGGDGTVNYVVGIMKRANPCRCPLHWNRQRFCRYARNANRY